MGERGRRDSKRNNERVGGSSPQRSLQFVVMYQELLELSCCPAILHSQSTDLVGKRGLLASELHHSPLSLSEPQLVLANVGEDAAKLPAVLRLQGRHPPAVEGSHRLHARVCLNPVACLKYACRTPEPHPAHAIILMVLHCPHLQSLGLKVGMGRPAHFRPGG